MGAISVAATGYGVSFPLLAIELEQSGLAPSMIGLNAAMPALGWLIMSLCLPWLHQRLSLGFLLNACLIASLLGFAGLWITDVFSLSLPFRFLFGGGLGMFFRMIELWINANAETRNRGKCFGVYGMVFIFGIMLGSGILPVFSDVPMLAYTCICAALLIALFVINALILDLPEHYFNTLSSMPRLGQIYRIAPAAIIGILVYGFFEDVPAYLLSVYALKIGHTEAVASYSLTAIAFGIFIFSAPLGWLSDKIGRYPLLFLGAGVGFSGAFIIPLISTHEMYFLGFLFIWGGAIASIYATSQALLGDTFENDGLLDANAGFGSVYAGAALFGPLINGMAMQLWEPHGLMLSSGITLGAFLLFLTMHRKAARYV